MSILPDKALHKMGPSLVDPFVSGNVQPASIDLRLFNEFIVFDSHQQTHIDLADVKDLGARKIFLQKDDSRGFVLHPGEFVLGATLEKIHCPNNIIARLEGKSSIGRLGIFIHVTAGFVDPGWEGRLTLEILNVRKIPIILRPGLPFCQISFQYMAAAAETPYAGRYQGDDGVSTSRYGQCLYEGDIAEIDRIPKKVQATRTHSGIELQKFVKHNHDGEGLYPNCPGCNTSIRALKGDHVDLFGGLQSEEM